MDHGGSLSHTICPRGTVFADAVASVRDGATDAAGAAAGLVGQMSDDELLWVLYGDYTALRGSGAFDHGEAVTEVGAWSGDTEAALGSLRLDGSGV